jgi:hypothetical protein
MKCHSHLNITDADIAIDHTWDRNLLPKCDRTEDNYFAKNGLLFSTKDELKKHLIAGIKKGQRSFEVKFSAKFPNQNEIGAIVQSAMQGSIQGIFKTAFFGGSYQMQLNEKRKTLSIIIK